MKKILMSLLTIAIVGALITGGVIAVFSDVETSQGNTFTAGTLDLKVNGEDDPITLTINISDMKPGDGMGGAEHYTIKYQWTLSNVGSLPGQPWIHITNLVDYENGVNEPEGLVDTTPGAEEGELSQYLMMQVNGAGSTGFHYPGGTREHELAYWVCKPLGKSGPQWDVIPPGGSIAALVLEFKLPSTVGNIIQSDSVEFDIEFHLDQVTP